MSGTTPKRRGRPPASKTTTTTKVPEPKVEESTGRVDELEKLLNQTLRELALYKSIGVHTDSPKVTVRHSGNGPQMIFKVEGGPSVVLNPRAPGNIGVIPLDSYHYHKTNTPWFSNGYVYVDGEETENPNLIIDVQRWVDSRDDSDLELDLIPITSQAALMALYNYTSEEPKSSKKAYLRKLVADKLSKVMGVDLIEDPGSDETGYKLRR